jgi:hypothetical protein
LTDRRQGELLIEVLHLYIRYGEESFRELTRALHDGSITKEIVELNDAVMVAARKEPRLLQRSVHRKPRRDEREELLERVRELEFSAAEKDRVVAELTRSIVDGKILQDARALRNFAEELGINAGRRRRTRWALVQEIVDLLLSAEIEYVKRCVGAARQTAGGSQLEGWAGIIVKDP